MGQQEIMQLLNTTGKMLDAQTIADELGLKMVRVLPSLKRLLKFKLIDAQRLYRDDGLGYPRPARVYWARS